MLLTLHLFKLIFYTKLFSDFGPEEVIKEEVVGDEDEEAGGNLVVDEAPRHKSVQHSTAVKPASMKLKTPCGF